MNTEPSQSLAGPLSKQSQTRFVFGRQFQHKATPCRDYYSHICIVLQLLGADQHSCSVIWHHFTFALKRNCSLVNIEISRNHFGSRDLVQEQNLQVVPHPASPDRQYGLRWRETCKGRESAGPYRISRRCHPGPGDVHDRVCARAGRSIPHPQCQRASSRGRHSCTFGDGA